MSPCTSNPEYLAELTYWLKCSRPYLNHLIKRVNLDDLSHDNDQVHEFCGFTDNLLGEAPDSLETLSRQARIEFCGRNVGLNNRSKHYILQTRDLGS